MKVDKNEHLIPKLVLHKAATSMGYRKSDSSKYIWSKPLGYTLLNIAWSESKVLMDQWFKGDTGKTTLWTSQELHGNEKEHRSLVSQIKYFETNSVRILYTGYSDKFQFLTPEETAQFLLDEK